MSDVDPVLLDAQSREFGFRILGDGDETRRSVCERHQFRFKPFEDEGNWWRQVLFKNTLVHVEDQTYFWLEREERREERNAVLGVNNRIETVAEVAQVDVRFQGVDAESIPDARYRYAVDGILARRTFEARG